MKSFVGVQELSFTSRVWRWEVSCVSVRLVTFAGIGCWILGGGLPKLHGHWGFQVSSPRAFSV